MQDDVKKLKELFLNIKKLGFIKSKRRGDTGIGYTFEELIQKPEENFPIPDYNSIEIKTYRKKSNKSIHLFSATPDGDFLFPIKRVVDILGYPDKKMKNSKVFNVDFYGNKTRWIGYYKKGIIVVNRNNKKVDLLAFDNNGNNLNVDISWSFDMLKNKLFLKLSNLAVISADSKYIKNEEYFHYDDIKFYKLKDFDTFIELIEKGKINICFNVGVYRYVKRIGQPHDRGVNFSIKKSDLQLLFDEIS